MQAPRLSTPALLVCAGIALLLGACDRSGKKPPGEEAASSTATEPAGGATEPAGTPPVPEDPAPAAVFGPAFRKAAEEVSGKPRGEADTILFERFGREVEVFAPVNEDWSVLVWAVMEGGRCHSLMLESEEEDADVAVAIYDDGDDPPEPCEAAAAKFAPPRR